VNFDEFFDEAGRVGAKIQFDNLDPVTHPAQRLSNEALFHLPLIAITILMLAKGRTKPTVQELGRVVGECFERTFPAFRSSGQHLGWSAALRVRTVHALSFLEQAKLAQVRPESKEIVATDLGRRVIDRALVQRSDLAQALLCSERGFRNMRVERQLRLTA